LSLFWRPTSGEKKNAEKRKRKGVVRGPAGVHVALANRGKGGERKKGTVVYSSSPIGCEKKKSQKGEKKKKGPGSHLSIIAPSCNGAATRKRKGKNRKEGGERGGSHTI